MPNSKEETGTVLASGLPQQLVAAWVFAVVTIWLIAIALAYFAPTPERLGASRTVIQVLSSWDGEHYAEIARNGYTAEHPERRRLAFFPLLPSISRLFGGATFAPLAGILLSQLSLLGSMILLGKLAYENAQKPVRLQPGFWLLVNPLGFYFHVYYAESLFLFFTLLLVWYFQRRNSWAAVPGLLAALTRPTAVTLPVIFLWETVRAFRRREKWLLGLICTIAPLAGLFIYLSYVAYVTEDIFGYIRIQSQWGSRWSFPFFQLFSDLLGFLVSLRNGSLRSVDQIVRLAYSFSILALLVWGWKKINPAYISYLVVSMLFIHSQEPHRSSARYEVSLFPVFLLLAQTVVARKGIAWFVAGLMIAAQILLFIRHADWVWVA
jgi:hypothetical protein